MARQRDSTAELIDARTAFLARGGLVLLHPELALGPVEAALPLRLFGLLGLSRFAVAQDLPVLIEHRVITFRLRLGRRRGGDLRGRIAQRLGLLGGEHFVDQPQAQQDGEKAQPDTGGNRQDQLERAQRDGQFAVVDVHDRLQTCMHVASGGSDCRTTGAGDSAPQ